MENLQANSWKHAKFNLATDLWVTEEVNWTTKKRTGSLCAPSGTCQSFDKTMPRSLTEGQHIFTSHKATIPHWVSITSQGTHKDKSHPNTPWQAHDVLMACLELATTQHLFLPHHSNQSETASVLLIWVSNLMINQQCAFHVQMCNWGRKLNQREVFHALLFL